MSYQLPLVIALLISCMAICAPDSHAAQVDSKQLTEIVKTLASDEFEGRAPGGPGEEKTVAYLVDRFQALGLAPGGENGGWTHAVPLIHTQVQAPATMGFDIVDQHQALEQATDIAIETSRPREEIIIEGAPVVFVGFGASAPERQWDDFGDIDLTGKVAVFLVNDPDFAAGPDEAVAGRFGNKRMTYYGRWMYKFEEAERRGALAALVIHEDKAAAYGWSVAASGPGENYSIVRAEGSTPPVALQGWLQGDAAAQLFASAGLDLDEQRVLARSPDFQAFELEGVTFSADLKVSVEHIESQNVLALLAGTTHPDEFLMVSSHWDAYGQGEPDVQGRTVRPGANDDALGTAGVLELARVLKAEAPLERSVVFAVWTAEESGLLGSTAYAGNPVYPLEKTVANFTFDIMQTAGPAKDVILVGEGQSDLQGDLERAAAGQGRVLTPESLPENGLFFRADHFSMARGGVPVLLIMGIAGASDLVDGGRAAGDAWIAEYVGNCYHQTCDEWSPEWDLRGAIMDMELFHTIVRELGDSRRWPQWNPGSEFRAVRTKSDAVRSNRTVGLHALMVMSWLLLQVADVVLDAFNVPDWTFRFLIIALAIGLVPAAVFSWVFEMTPDGIIKESEVDPGQSVTPATGRKLNYVTIGMVIIGIVFVLVQQRQPEVQQAPATTTPSAPDMAPDADSRSIAVLPFVNMSSDAENEYFADGLSEELLNQLAQVPNLQVAGRTSSFSFKGKNEDLRMIGTMLGVANVLEGSVRRQGDHVRVTAQLIRVSDGFHLWSNNYDRTMDDVFAIQDDISANVANALKIILDEPVRQRMQAAGVRDVDAFVEFQKGSELFDIAHGASDLIGTMRKGLVHYDRAIELVPGFAAAYWQKSDYYAHVILESSSTEEERESALLDLRAVLDAAYQLSGDSKRKAFIDVDRVLFSDDWTPLHDRIEKAFATTGCPEPTWMEVATGIGYAEAAEDMWARYQRCEPLSSSGPLQLSGALFWQDDYESALEVLNEGEILLGSNPWYSANRQRVLMALGRADEALALAPEVTGDLAFFGMTGETLPLALSGNIEGARLAMERWQAAYGRNLRNEIEIHAAMGDRQRANELAAEIDARPGGPMLLLLTVMYCACGATFDLEATPNFRARLKESGTPWPPKTHIKFPAKDW